MLCIKKKKTEKLKFRKSTVHCANNGVRTSKVRYIVTFKQFLQIHHYLDLDSLNLTQWTKIATIIL